MSPPAPRPGLRVGRDKGARGTRPHLTPWQINPLGYNTTPVFLFLSQVPFFNLKLYIATRTARCQGYQKTCTSLQPIKIDRIYFLSVSYLYTNTAASDGPSKKNRAQCSKTTCHQHDPTKSTIHAPLFPLRCPQRKALPFLLTKPVGCCALPRATVTVLRLQNLHHLQQLQVASHWQRVARPSRRPRVSRPPPGSLRHRAY